MYAVSRPSLVGTALRWRNFADKNLVEKEGRMLKIVGFAAKTSSYPCKTFYWFRSHLNDIFYQRGHVGKSLMKDNGVLLNACWMCYINLNELKFGKPNLPREVVRKLPKFLWRQVSADTDLQITCLPLKSLSMPGKR